MLPYKSNNFWGEVADAYFEDKIKKMGLEIQPDDLDYKIEKAYREEDYAKANQLLDLRKKLFPKDD